MSQTYLGANGYQPLLTLIEHVLDESSRLALHHRDICAYSARSQPVASKTAVLAPRYQTRWNVNETLLSFQKRRAAKVHPPSVVIGTGNNTTEAEDCLALNVSFSSRGEYRAVRDHQVFGNLWVGYYDE